MNQKPTILLGLLVTVAALCWGCGSAKQPEPTSLEDSTATWKAMEKQSQGHSPRGQFQLAEPPTIIDTPAAVGKPTAKQELPTTRMSLRMHNADIVAVLQALSRAAGKSIVLAPGVAGTINVNIVDRPWNEVFLGILAANKLTHSFDGETIRIMAASDLQGVLDLEAIQHKTQAEKNAALKEEPLVTSVTKVRFADAKLLKPTVERSMTKDKDGKPVGSVEVDDLTNSLIVQSVDSDIPKLTRLLSMLDAPRSQIKLKAHIVETTKEVARDLGILWGGNFAGDVRSGNKLGLGGAYAVSNTSSGSSGSTTVTSTLGQGNLGSLGLRLPASTVLSSQTGAALDVTFGKIGGNILETQLEALANENKLNIISSPSISTMDNQKAYTESGERVPYQTVSGTGADATYSVAFQDAVLRLEITPHIIDDQFIKLQVLIQKDEVDTSRTVAGNPYIVKKKTETTLIARNGETVVISGLSQLRNQLNEAGVPGLKDVPGLGWLAKSQYKDDLKDEFMIFITPEVLADWRAGERQKSYEELERELNAAKQAEAVLEKAAEGKGQNAIVTPQPAGTPLVVAPQSAAPAPAGSELPNVATDQSAAPRAQAVNPGPGGLK